MDESDVTAGPGEVPDFFWWAAAAARSQFGPAEEWDQFVVALWHQLNAGFGLSEDVHEVHRPRAWFEHPKDGPVTVWDENRSGH